MTVGWRAWNFFLSIAFVVGAVVLLWVQRGPGYAVLFVIIQPLVLPFVWFADSLGSWIGIPPMPGGLGSRPITRESPPFFILAFSWLILFSISALLLFYA